MTLLMGTASVPGNATVAVIAVPAGVANATIWQATPNAQPVYIGLSPNVTPTNGIAVTVTPGDAQNYNTSRGAIIYATTGNATASTFSYIVNTGA